MMSLAGWSAGALWFAGALLLGIAELIAPGFFLVFAAAGAAVTGLVLLAMPGLHVIAQMLLFALFSGGAILIGRGWYRGLHHMVGDTRLNDRTGKLIGRTVEVCDAIVAGEGRVRVGDGAWTARGPDAPGGAMVRIIGAEGNVLVVEPA